MNRVRVEPYGPSNSAKAVAQALTATGNHGRVLRLLKGDRSRFRCRNSDLIINWGTSNQRFNPSNYINKPASVGLAANKLKTFQQLERSDVSVPDWTTSRDEASQWVRDGHVVYARTKLSGNSGDGIVLVDNVDAMVSAPLYTKQFICDQEYRIHVVKTADGFRAFDVQQKKKRQRTEEEREAGVRRDNFVRNHGNGWVFCRGGVSAPVDAIAQAGGALEALQLDFAGVDVGYDTESRRAVVYEVNTACGLEGTTLDKYTSMLSSLILNRG